MTRAQLEMGIVAMAALVLGAGLAALSRRPAANAEPLKRSNTPTLGGKIDRLRAEVATLKSLLPDQSHAMSDVGYHFTNLWFAAEKQNWALADFYFKETRSHLEWAVRIKPVRKDNSNKDVDLPKILEAMKNGPLKQLEVAVAVKSPDKFVAAYRFTLENCYACHKASDKPYLRPHIPPLPHATIINVDPQADWPR